MNSSALSDEWGLRKEAGVESITPPFILLPAALRGLFFSCDFAAISHSAGNFSPAEKGNGSREQCSNSISFRANDAVPGSDT